ncbi:UDP-glucosyltransferase precursor [Danaus plexippus plexippus]|uniref:UDP-glucosyltransferase n=1 Tax=Danaus plexippus plexippus TaxID=278856 RepID=A0A212FM09_DANPL|nr:UDP-glucosyltransferase precursor [Danaus plexippus plexippus]
MQCTGFLFLVYLCCAGAYKILVISPMPAKSHSILTDAIVKHLSSAGHEKLLSDKNEYFDVLIIEWMFTEVYAGLSNVYNCPYIWFSSVEPHWMILDLVDESPNPSYNADITSDSVPPFSFLQRVKELSFQALGRLLRYYYTSSVEKQLYEEYLIPHIKSRGGEIFSLDTLKYNASLLLSNSHVSLGMPVRHPANFIPIGGYHIDSNVKPLPQNLQSIMDNATHGVIYFSMGSNLRSNHFPDEIKQSLLKIFGKLNQTVLWKFEEDLPNRPSNVHILQWAPQQSILGKMLM